MHTKIHIDFSINGKKRQFSQVIIKLDFVQHFQQRIARKKGLYWLVAPLPFTSSEIITSIDWRISLQFLSTVSPTSSFKTQNSTYSWQWTLHRTRVTLTTTCQQLRVNVRISEPINNAKSASLGLTTHISDEQLLQNNAAISCLSETTVQYRITSRTLEWENCKSHNLWQRLCSNLKL